MHLYSNLSIITALLCPMAFASQQFLLPEVFLPAFARSVPAVQSEHADADTALYDRTGTV